MWGGIQAAASLLLACVYVLLPAVMGRTVDAVLGRGDTALWLTLTAVTVALLVVCDTVDDYAGAVANARCTAWLRHTLLGHVLDLGAPAARRHTPGDLVARLVGNTARAGSAPSGLVWAVTELVPPIGAIVALALIDPWLCLTFVAGLPLVVLVVRAFVRDVSDLNDRYFATQGRIATRLVDALTGIRTIAAAGTTSREAERVLEPLPELHRHGLGMWQAFARVSARDAAIVPLLEIAVLAVAGLGLAQGRITPGQMLAASGYVLLATGVSSLVASVNRLAFARATAGRIAEILGEPTVAYGAAHLPSGGGGRLEFRGVTVRTADGDTALDCIDLALPPGALTAVVGRSGSGKSLLAALAGRLADPDEGEVRLDGQPLCEVPRPELRRAVAYGFERPVLLGDTYTDAIGFGPRTPDAVEVRTAATAAHADAFIRTMPDGYATPLAAAPLSGGETQRIGLARAFLQSAPHGRLLILDDATASLDTVTEHHISQSLTTTGPLSHRTRLITTHRTSTAARADVVVWLDGGRVRGVGTHRELWGEAGYRAVFGAGVGGLAGMGYPSEIGVGAGAEAKHRPDGFQGEAEQRAGPGPETEHRAGFEAETAYPAGFEAEANGRPVRGPALAPERDGGVE
ncbi:MAG: ABC transporter ATP-binding protein [Streptomyces sp.]|nr:ABC transporter ATP-binding protein [Streptomyces sp.]